MKRPLYVICTWAGAALFGLTWLTSAANAPAADKHAASLDIDGSYELLKRLKSDGKEILSPTIGGIYSLSHGRGNLNLFWKEMMAR